MADSIGSPRLWAGFIGLVLGLLVLDLRVVHRRAHAVGLREALGWSVAWVAMSLVFGAGVWVRFGHQAGLEFLTGYVIEKALSVDNLFVFAVIFSSFGVPAAYQHRVLFWGILGALVMRAVFILAGAALLARFHFVFFLFGGFLVLTGIRILFTRPEIPHPERHPAVRLFRRLVPMTADYRGTRFLVRDGARWLATPLLLVLLVVEATDVIFAVDSIPAVFAVTRDPFIVFTSNICAILGLRALYFLIAGLIDRFRYLKVGLGLALVFVGVKMLLSDVYHISIDASLGVIALLIGGSIAASLWRPTGR